MLLDGMASLLITPPLLGIVCVPPSISPPWCGVAAHAETVTTKATAPAQAIALFIARCRIRVHMYLPFQSLVMLTPAAEPFGRPREVEVASRADAILYIAPTGCEWRMLPKDFPSFMTVEGHFCEPLFK